MLSDGVVGAYQQVADDGVLGVAQGRDGDDRGETAAVLAYVGQFVDVFDPPGRFEHQRFESRRDGSRKLEAQRFRARYHFARIGDVRGSDLVHHFRGLVTQHAFRAYVEDLDDAFRVRRYARKVRAVEYRALQGALIKEGLFRILPRGDIAQYSGEEPLPAQNHFAHRDFQRE